MASLGVLPDPGLGNPLVMTVGPCPACAERADGQWQWGRCQTPSEADANLIAAAPELLAALVLVTQRCGPNSSDGAVARAAIAKARGLTDPLTTQEQARG